jgi:hypothetical protein
MQVLDKKLGEDIVAKLKLSKGLKSRLSFLVIANMDSSAWADYEMLAIPAKDGTAGVLLIETSGNLYASTYEIRALNDSLTGQTKPVVCDFCKTWQAGGRAGRITFGTKRSSINSLSFLCCLDLACSLHVRGTTKAAELSKTQLREDILPEDRIKRLNDSLLNLISRLSLQPIIFNN